MFNEKNVRCIQRVFNWEVAIKEAAQPLINNGDIADIYVEKIIKNTKKMGFYMVLDDYIAMPHARPEDGVKNTSIAFLKLNEAVNFGTEKVYLIFLVAAKDANTHIDILKGLMFIFQNEELKKKLIEAKTKEELLEILKGVDVK